MKVLNYLRELYWDILQTISTDLSWQDCRYERAFIADIERQTHTPEYLAAQEADDAEYWRSTFHIVGKEEI